MELFQAITPGLRSNTELPITTIVSDIDFRIEKYTTYAELIRMYDPNLLQCLRTKDDINNRIILIEVSMFPEDMHWM